MSELRTPIDEKAVFDNFKFALGQLVRHKVSGEAGIVVTRTLIQAQTGNTGHMYTLSFTMLANRKGMLEIELETVDGQA